MVTKAKPLPRSHLADNRIKSPIAIGFDLSLSSLAGCIKMYDGTLKEMRGPEWIIKRWGKDVPHFQKLKEISKGHVFVIELLTKAGGFIKDDDDLFIGVEALPNRVLNASRAHQQAQLIGCFIGSLLRYGWNHVEEVNIKQWQKLVADDLEIKVNADFDKWTVRSWAIEVFDMPRWKDLIYNGKRGLIPKPKTSNAKPVQPDDRYDATGIMEWVWESNKLGRYV